MAERFSNRPSFADNFDRTPPRQSGDASDGDPLAELARLIGQTDPQSNFARGRQSSQPQPPRSLATDFAAGPPSWLQTAQAQQARPQPTRVEQQPHHATEEEPELTPMPAFLQTQHPQHAQHPEHVPHAPTDRYDQVLYGQDQEQQYEEYDEQQEYSEEYADEQFDDRPGFRETEKKGRRSGGLLTVAVVLGLAVVGTAGAYAYRSYSGSPRNGTPPVIKADNAPSKVVPPTSGDGSGKLIYDRIGNSGGPERVVSREEQPVDVNANASRSVFPSVGQGAGQTQQASNAADDGGGDSPRKIRTVPIRGDQANGAPPAAKSTPPVPNAVRTVPVPPAAPAQAATNAPISLSPAAPAPSTVRSASAAVPPPAAAPPTNVTRTTGGFLVQIASQKSEADAQTSFRAAQAKYTNLIGTMSPIIKRADLGDKGVYYRAMVGPFSTQEEAKKLCSNLTIAGGSCVVQRN